MVCAKLVEEVSSQLQFLPRPFPSCIHVRPKGDRNTNTGPMECTHGIIAVYAKKNVRNYQATVIEDLGVAHFGGVVRNSRGMLDSSNRSRQNGNAALSIGKAPIWNISSDW